jgi:monoamine oxidase
MSERILDYGVVGGGIAGVYSAWRLAKDSDSETSIELFEMSERVGGRLLTVVPPQMPSARVELGGMRYIYPAQAWVSSLVEHLGLETEPLPADDPQNIAYVRGVLLRMFELTDVSKLPYDVRPDEGSENDLGNLTAVTAARALRPTIKQLLGIDVETWEDLAKLSPADWRRIATEGTYEGVPLSSLPMRYTMLRSISNEALHLGEDTGGYTSILYTWNAADGFPWNVGDFGSQVEYNHVKDGYDQLPLMLAREFEQAGGTIHLGARLESFRMTEHGHVALEVEENGTTRTVLAYRLILAMPRRSLELLDQTGEILDRSSTDVHALIRSVTPIPLFKLAICYPNPWWEDVEPVDPGTGKRLRISSGRSVTDLPIRQCYYWKVDPETNHAVILIYNDGRHLDYWAGLRDSRAPSFESEYAADEAALPGWSSYPAPQRMVDEVHRQLLEMHGIADASKVPPPYAGAYRDWGEDPYGGGANFWHVGVRSYDVAQRVIQPKPPLPVYICGECYSHGQGWVEGALETAEEMLQQHLGLPKPAWKKHYQAATKHAEAELVRA